MSFVSRLIWKSLSKSHRKLLLSVLTEPNRQLVNSTLSNKTEYPNLFDEHQFIFIHIPKVAGISLIHALGFEQQHKWHMPLKYYEANTAKKFDQYFKFAFVRNPWDRAYSAYTFLQKGGISERDDSQSRIIKSYASYEDFVMKWLSHEASQSLIHFCPMYSFMQNTHGEIAIDFIGRYENLQTDYDYIRSQINIGEQLPQKNVSRQSDFREVYTTQMIDKIARVYERDIAEFDYDF